MAETPTTPMDLITQLTLQRSAFRKAEYTTVGSDEKSGGLKFEKIEDVVPEARIYHGKVGEVKGTVDSLLQQEIRRRESATGDERITHALKTDKLAAMKTILDIDLELVWADMDPMVTDEVRSTMNDQSWGMYRQQNRDKLMTQYDLATTRQMLDSVLVRRTQACIESENDPTQLAFKTATENLITFVDRISTPSTQTNQAT